MRQWSFSFYFGGFHQTNVGNGYFRSVLNCTIVVLADDHCLTATRVDVCINPYVKPIRYHRVRLPYVSLLGCTIHCRGRVPRPVRASKKRRSNNPPVKRFAFASRYGGRPLCRLCRHLPTHVGSRPLHKGAKRSVVGILDLSQVSAILFDNFIHNGYTCVCNVLR